MKKLIILSTILIFLDQITKFIFTDQYFGNRFFAIVYTENTGAAFGLAQNSVYFLGILSLIISLGILYYYPKLNNKYLWIILFSGAIGNAIDRFYFGYVRDFIAIYIWPNFNLADIYTTTAIIILIYYMLTNKKVFKASKT